MDNTINIDELSNKYVDLWIKQAKLGCLATEMPSYIHDKFGNYISLNDFYDLTKNSKNKEIQAKYEVGFSHLNRYLKEMMADAASSDDESGKSKATTAAANLMKVMAVEAGWASKELDKVDNSANFQLRLEVNSELLAFMTKLGIFQVADPELLKSVPKSTVNYDNEAYSGKKAAPVDEKPRLSNGGNNLVKPL